MALTDLKKELKKLGKEELIEIIADLYKKNKSAKEFLDFYANPGEQEKELLEKYREQVRHAFFPKRGFQLKLKEGKKAISDFKKLGPSPEALADLMLFYVEMGVKFTLDYGDIDEGFYSSLETVYLAALQLMKKARLLDKFEVRARVIVEDTGDIGWGFHDELQSYYSEFYLNL